MGEYRLFSEDVPFVSTAEFHADRERAPHLEQDFHRPRLEMAAAFIQYAATAHGGATVSDLGCGDGGLLSLLKNDPKILAAWGYDFCPANATGWEERGVKGYYGDVFGKDWEKTTFGDIVVMTEVLEHLDNPHGALRGVIAEEGVRYLVCSSPWNENLVSHSAEHAWAWDIDGYPHMIMEAGWKIIRHETAGLFQVVLAEV